MVAVAASLPLLSGPQVSLSLIEICTWKPYSLAKMESGFGSRPPFATMSPPYPAYSLMSMRRMLSFGTKVLAASSVGVPVTGSMGPGASPSGLRRGTAIPAALDVAAPSLAAWSVVLLAQPQPGAEPDDAHQQQQRDDVARGRTALTMTKPCACLLYRLCSLGNLAAPGGALRSQQIRRRRLVREIDRGRRRCRADRAASDWPR